MRPLNIRELPPSPGQGGMGGSSSGSAGGVFGGPIPENLLGTRV